MKRRDSERVKFLRSRVLKVLSLRAADRKESSLTDDEWTKFYGTEMNLDWDSDVEFMKAPTNERGFNLLN